MRLPIILPTLVSFLICSVCFGQVEENDFEEIYRLMRADEVEQAESKARALLKESPTDLETRMLLAQILKYDGRPEETIKLTQAGLDHVSEDDQRYNLSIYIGVIAMEIAEDGPFVERKRGTVTYRPPNDSDDEQAFVERYVGIAETSFQRAVDLFEDDQRALHGLAKAVSFSSTPERAIPLWTKLLDRDQSETPEFESEYIALLFKVKRDEEAVKLANKRLEEQPNDRATIEMLVEHYKEKENTEALDLLTARAEFLDSIPPFLNLEFSEENKKRLAKLEDDKEVESLLAIKTEESTEMLVVYVWRHPHNELEDRAFVELGNREAIKHLNDLFENASSTCTVRGAINQLARSKPNGLFEELVRLLPGDLRSFGMQMDIANALETLQDERAVEPLIETLAVNSKPEPEDDHARFMQDREFARWRAAIALGAFDSDRATMALKTGLENEVIRIACLAGLYRKDNSEKWLEEIKAVVEEPENDRQTTRQTIVVLDRLSKKLPEDTAVEEIFEALKTQLEKKQ